MARGLARRRIDQPQFGRISVFTILAFLLFGDEQPGEYAGLAQQTLEALMRRRLPAFQRAARIGIDARRLDAHQQLQLSSPPPSSATAQVGLSVVS